MKLLRCNECCDIFNLTELWKACSCGETKGRYINDLEAIYDGDCTPIGFANFSFYTGVLNQPECGLGRHFTAFVIPKKCDTFRREQIIS